MDQQRRLLLFGLTCFLILFGWASIGPKLFPGLFPKPKPKDQIVNADDPAPQDDGNREQVDPDPEKPAEIDPADDDPPQQAQPDESDAKLPDHPVRVVTLGSDDPKSGYALAVDLTTVGASVVRATLNDPRYIVADDPVIDEDNPVRPQLSMVGNDLAGKPVEPLNIKRRPVTLDLDFDPIDEALSKVDPNATLRTISWKVVETTQDPLTPGTKASAIFELNSPDGEFTVRKTYRLNRLTGEQLKSERIRDREPKAYQLDLSIEITNSGSKQKTAEYVLQGPVGVPLENVDNTRKYRDIKAGFLQEDGSLNAQTLAASSLVSDFDEDDVEEWTSPFKYIGVDVQYFAVLLMPEGKQLKTKTFARARPTIIDRATESERSDISVELTSRELAIKPNETIKDDFRIFLGPKRAELLTAYRAEDIIDHGWFAGIAHIMEWLLDTFHGWGAPYGVAIIMLTMIVRGCMFPISKKQALSSKKMKELQPEMTALREKYKEDRQKLAQAQMELYRKANFNPFAGCLPVFLQLPIFIGLYRALSNSVDLRMAPFLYIDDLSAPDALFAIPQLPFIGSEFNLLPLITMVLFWLQQKMFMPPPQNDEMAMQQKMMSYMMIFFGFLFYHVPSGLCVYFIASSGWGMAERKLLELLPEKKRPEKPEKPRKEGWLARKMKEMQEIAEMQQQLQAKQNPNGGSGKGGKKRRS